MAGEETRGYFLGNAGRAAVKVVTMSGLGRAGADGVDEVSAADAAGLAILPGLVRYDEAVRGPIRHAMRVTVRATNGYVWPASHQAGNTGGALPMGARLRLKASKDLSSYPPIVRNIFRGMQTHGLIVADNGTDLYVSGAMDSRWNNDELNPAFRSLTANDFEVVSLGWR